MGLIKQAATATAIFTGGALGIVGFEQLIDNDLRDKVLRCHEISETSEQAQGCVEALGEANVDESDLVLSLEIAAGVGAIVSGAVTALALYSEANRQYQWTEWPANHTD